MRKTPLALVLVLVLLITMALPALAAPRIRAVAPTLTFQGTTAICKVTVRPGKASDSIHVTMKLFKQGELIKTWTGSDTGYLYLEREKEVERGYDYQLSVTATIDGTTYPIQIVVASCD